MSGAEGKGGNGAGREGEARKIPIKDQLRAPLPKRFYASVAVEPVEDGFRITLDGRPVKTPGKRALEVPTEALAAAIAAEWNAQGPHIDPATMPLTRLANTAIDAVSVKWDAVAADVVAFAGSDLLCYRAEAPAGLVRRQAEAWDPVLAWARRELDVGLVCQSGLMPIAQPVAALEAVGRALKGLDALSLAAVHVLTTLSGSAVLALAVLRRHLSADDAWKAALVDETWQSEQWGVDHEAEVRLAQRRAEFSAASEALRLLASR